MRSRVSTRHWPSATARKRRHLGGNPLAARRMDHLAQGGFQGSFGIEGRPLDPGICGTMPLVALEAAHEPRMSVACCIAYAFIMSVALGSGRCVLPANDEAAVESTPGSLRADGPAAAGLGNLLADR